MMMRCFGLIPAWFSAREHLTWWRISLNLLAWEWGIATENASWILHPESAQIQQLLWQQNFRWSSHEHLFSPIFIATFFCIWKTDTYRGLCVLRLQIHVGNSLFVIAASTTLLTWRYYTMSYTHLSQSQKAFQAACHRLTNSIRYR